MHDHACIKQAAHTLHIRNPIVYTFHFCPGRGEAAVVHARVKCYDGCAPSALPRQGPPEARPMPHLEASSPRPILLFPFNTQNRGVQDAAATIGRPGRFIQTRQANTSKQQVCTNMQELDTIGCR